MGEIIRPNDLASSMGFVSSDHPDIPKVQDAIARVLAAAKAAGKYAGMVRSTPYRTITDPRTTLTVLILSPSVLLDSRRSGAAVRTGMYVDWLSSTENSVDSGSTFSPFYEPRSRRRRAYHLEWNGVEQDQSPPAKGMIEVMDLPRLATQINAYQDRPGFSQTGPVLSYSCTTKKTNTGKDQERGTTGLITTVKKYGSR